MFNPNSHSSEFSFVSELTCLPNIPLFAIRVRRKITLYSKISLKLQVEFSSLSFVGS